MTFHIAELDFAMQASHPSTSYSEGATKGKRRKTDHIEPLLLEGDVRREAAAREGPTVKSTELDEIALGQTDTQRVAEDDNLDDDIKPNLTVIVGALWSPSPAIIRSLRAEPYGRVANFIAMAQSSLYKLSKAEKPIQPRIFHHQYPYDFGDEFYRIFTQLALDPDVPLGQNRINAVVKVIITLTSVQAVDSIESFLKRSVARTSTDAFLHISEVDTTKASVKLPDGSSLVNRIVRRSELLQKHRIADSSTLSLLYRIQDTAHRNKSRYKHDLDKLVATTISEDSGNRRKLMKAAKSRLQNWFLEGRCAGSFLASSTHEISPGVFIILSSSRIWRSLNATTSLQLGRALSTWPGFIECMSALTEIILLPSLDPAAKPASDSTWGLQPQAALGGVGRDLYSCIAPNDWESQQSDGDSHMPRIFELIDEMFHLVTKRRRDVTTHHATAARNLEPQHRLWPMSFEVEKAKIQVKELSRVDIVRQPPSNANI